MQQNRNSNIVMESATIQKNEASSKSPTSRRHFLSYFVIATFAVSALLTSCGGGGGIGSSSYKIKMTTEAIDDFSIWLYGSGVATVDWGDGSEKVTQTLKERMGIYGGVNFLHPYSNASLRTITINGDNITGLQGQSGNSNITSLDVSKNTALTELNVYGNFTSLDVSKNTALTKLSIYLTPLTSLDVSNNTALTELNVYYITTLTSLDVSKNTMLLVLRVYDNQLTSSALNALFGTLHNNAGEKTIYIGGNPGAKDCDRSIAESKGWTVKDTSY